MTQSNSTRPSPGTALTTTTPWMAAVWLLVLFSLPGCPSTVRPVVETPVEQQPASAAAPPPGAGAVCRPTPTGIPEIQGHTGENTSAFLVPGGLSVLLKETPGNPVVALQLLFDGGSRLVTGENAGIQQLALSVATSGGTTQLDKSGFFDRLNAMGTVISYGTDLDYSTIEMTCLAVYLPESFDLLRAVLLDPAFPRDEFERSQESQIQDILMREENPDSVVVDMARALLFEGHPYTNPSWGTVQSVSSLTLEEVRDFYADLFDTSRMLLVVVGPVDQDEITALVGDTFSRFPASGNRPERPGPLTVEATRAEVAPAAIPTNYILGMAPAPAPGHEDYPATVLAMQHLSDRFFEQVRTANNLAYAVSAGMSQRLANYLYVYVSTTEPEKALALMRQEMARLQETLLSDRELADLISVFITSYHLGLDSNESLAQMLGWWQLFGGGLEQADAFVAALQRVTPDEIRRVANRYLQRFQYGAMGDTRALALDLF